MGERIVTIEDVSKRYGTFEAVSHVSLDVRRGDFVSLLGPSGCGKSTILRMIAGFETVNEGSIRINGIDVSDVPPHRRPVNMVFQSYALFPHLTVADNIAFGPRRQRLPRAEVGRRVERFLALVGMEGLGGRYPSQLSGGQQQRVALARALVNQPQVLLLDEPLGALDLKLRKRMQIELKQLQRELGISFIYVTHDQDEALALSDRIAVINKGTVLQYAPGREIYDHPRTEFVANFLGESNVIAANVVTPGSTPTLDVAGSSVGATDPEGLARVAGERVLIAIRPENLRLGAEPFAADTVLPCQVAEKAFLGSSFLVHVRFGDEVLVAARGTDRKLFDSLGIGQPAYVGWRAGDAQLVRP
jgi:spermidine/putrescine ABC transporter ATP-binding subunit